MGVGHLNTYAQGSGLVIDIPKSVERTTKDERWPLPVATLFVVSTSVALWTGIFLVVSLVV
jgi:hypothetical protein